MGTIRRIYDGALDQPSKERLSYVEMACGKDSTLRDDVLRLLDHADADSADGKHPIAAFVHQLDALRGSSLVGQTLRQYRIDGWLGSGGMGDVYRATDSKLDREVAIKVLPARSAPHSDPSAISETIETTV